MNRLTMIFGALFVCVFVQAKGAAGCETEFGGDLVGTWVFKGLESDEGRVESCPPAIKFHQDGTYVVLNDCYGDDSDYPLVEDGAWSFADDNQHLIMSEREFASNYRFHGSGDRLEGEVKSISDEILVICFQIEQSCVNEVYSRISIE